MSELEKTELLAEFARVFLTKVFIEKTPADKACFEFAGERSLLGARAYAGVRPVKRNATRSTGRITMTQQERIELLADFALALFTSIDVLEKPVEESFNTLLTREPFAAIATAELRAKFTGEME